MAEHTLFVENLRDYVPDIPADSIVSRTFYSDERVKAILFGFAAGQELSEHTAARPAMLQFLAGEATLILGEEVRTVEAGAWAYMPPHLPHSISATSETVMLLLLL